MKIETTVEIAKPPSEVYAFLMDEENLSLWIKNFIRLEHLTGEGGAVGSTSKHIYNENGKTVEFIEEITAIEENRLFEGILTGDHMTVQISNKLVATKEGTRLIASSDITPRNWIIGVFMWFAQRKINRRQQEDLERLKEAIEGLGEEYDV